MVGLPDIAPGSETVTVSGHKITVLGVSAAGVAILLGRFPELRKLYAGKKVDVERMIALGPEVVAAAIAAGVGCPGDESEEAKAMALPIGPQTDLLAAILRVTLPGGLRPLALKLNALSRAAGVQIPAAGAAAPSGKGRASKSRKPSKRS